MQPRAFNPLIILAISLLVSVHGKAQQPASGAKPVPQAQAVGANYHANYTFTILTGAGNVYGYDILKNGVVVLHQPAEQNTIKTLTLKTNIQATRAAMFVTYKMKNNIQPVALSNDELKKATVN